MHIPSHLEKDSEAGLELGFTGPEASLLLETFFKERKTKLQVQKLVKV